MEVNINWDRFDSTYYRPLIEEEIPDYNPGTIAYDDFWDEQDNRCINGYKPRAYMPSITGEHYFYLNMCNIELLEPGATRKSMGSPFYRELDRRLFDEIHQAKRGHYGLVIGKPRRVGLSWVGSTSSAYELLFYKGNKIGVAAGQDDKAQDFYEKVQYLLDNIRPEYRSSISVRNADEIRLSYQYTENKQKKEGGLKSSMYMKTMYAKPTGFEGKSLSMVIFEEAGLFEDLIAAYKSTEPCFKEGSIQFGTPLVYGTGGEIDKGSKGYKSMWHSRKETYNLKKVFVSATDYYPGDGIPDEETGEKISFFDFRTGRTNSKAAHEHIIKERLEKEGSEGYVKHIQSYPLKEADIFIKNSGGYLNRQKLNAQLANLDNCPYEIKTGRIEWKTNDPITEKLAARAKNLKEYDKIHFTRGSKAVFVDDKEFGTVKKIMDPIDSKNLPYCPDLVACDSYDDEVKEGTGSEGATIVYRCFYSINKVCNLPIAYILDRGTSDEDDVFYSQTFRLTVYYGSEMLLEYTKIAIKQHFIDCGGTKHLAGRPDIDGYSSNAANTYGFKMSNQHSWKLSAKLLKAEVNNFWNNIWFEEILLHLIDFGEENSDLGSAFAMAMIYKMSIFGDLTDGIEEDHNDVSELDGAGTWVVNENGQYEYQTFGQLTNKKDPYSYDEDLIQFKPEYDLEGYEKEKYESTIVENQRYIEKERQDILDKYGHDPMSFILNEHHKKINNN